MDAEAFYLSLVLLFFGLVSVSLHFLFYSRKAQPTSAVLPPGTTGFLFLGETLEFLSTGWKGHPEKFIFDRVAKFSSDVFKTSLLGETAAVFCGPAGNKFLFSNEGTLVTSWWPSSVNKIFPSSTKTSAGEESKKMRYMLPQFLKPDALHRSVGIMDDVAGRHFAADWENHDQVATFHLAKRYTFLLACRLFMSVEDPHHVAQFAQPFQLVGAGVISIPINLPGTTFNRAIKAASTIKKELRAIIKQRKEDLAAGAAEPSQDILSHMLVATDENGRLMGEMEIADKILGLLIGGYDTASAACTFIVKYLAEMPHVYDQVFNEQREIAESKGEGELLNWEDLQKMKYSWNVAREVLRLTPPLQGAFREVLNDFIFDGFLIPKGWKLYWSANSTHKNPKYFPEPDKFEPRRFEGTGPAPYTFVPFGGGPRMCPGKEYARLEILVFMHNLVKRFRWEKLIANENIIINPLPMPSKGLPIRLHPHTST